MICLIKQEGGRGSGWNLTCDQTLAGISSGDGVNAIGGIWNLVSPVFDGDGVTARHVRHVRHCVRPVPVVPNVSLLWLSLWILELAHKHNSDGHASNRASYAIQTGNYCILQKRITNLINLHYKNL